MEWLLPPDAIDVSALQEAVGGCPLVARILARRGMTDVGEALAFLDPARYTPAPSGDLPDVDAAARRLLEAIRKRERILVWGDFDVDGQASTALLVEALRDLGGDAVYHIPHRLQHGHGVQPDILRGYLEDGFRVVLTCDTGVAAHQAAEIARAAGAAFLITDHHALPDRLPDADAVVNPQRLPGDHALRDLPGVGVAYKLAEHLYQMAGRGGEEHSLLDLAALGIVADVATQRRDTRYLLQVGLDRLRNPRRVGLQMLMQAAKVDPLNLSADTIGYQVGPRLNALGRLGDASLAVELLTTHDEGLAEQIATRLELLNNQRKQIDDQIYAAAQEQIAREPSLLDSEALVLAGEWWHLGVIGVVAARLVEQYDRPVVLLASPPGEIARGSARSVPGVDIGAALAACADLLQTHGGHPGAAGCSLDPDLIPHLRRRLSAAVETIRRPDAVIGRQVDAGVSLAEMTPELAGELDRLAPFGEGNPPPHLMASHLSIASASLFGAGSKHRRVTVEDAQGSKHTVVWWRGSDHPLPRGVFDLLYIPRFSDYKGRRQLQIEWVDSRPTPGIAVEVEPERRMIDLRREPDPLASLPTQGLVIFVEGAEPGALPFDQALAVSRSSVRSSAALAIWTVPPGSGELRQVVEAVGAHTLYAIGQHGPDDTPESFIRRLVGLVKYAARAYGGEVSIPRLAAATAQRESAVRRGLDWLAARGEITVSWQDPDTACIALGGSQADDALEPIEAALHASLAESAAYRAFFRRAELRRVLE